MSLNVESSEVFDFYLLHHAVVRHDCFITKTRVVFDGSTETSTGVPLNDTLMVGPKLQDDLFIILNQNHSQTFVLTAEKMYNQVVVHPDDVKYQIILSPKVTVWRIKAHAQHYNLWHLFRIVFSH